MSMIADLLRPHEADKNSGFQPFVMEAMMSEWENDVEINLSESGVHPLTLRELLELGGDLEQLLDLELLYPQVNGIPLLRQRIASLYGDNLSGEAVSEDQVLVTVGCAEALFLVLQTLAEPGAEMAVMRPNYMHAWGTAQNLGWGVKSFRLREEEGWAPDLDELESVVGPKTKLIAVCNPNNPTGYILTEGEMERIVNIAEKVGAWILADEVYGGAERQQEERTPSFHGLYDRVLALGSLSKAYGLPGLRVGWMVGPRGAVDACWRRHEYTTISVTMLSNHLAAAALSPEVYPRLMERTRRYVRRGYDQLEAWMGTQGGRFRAVAPQAAAIAFLRYDLEIGSTEFVERLIRQKSTLIVPGDHYGMDGYVRISFGPPSPIVGAGLGRIAALADEI